MKEREQPISVVTMSSKKETTFIARTTTQKEERTCPLNERGLPPNLRIARSLEGAQHLVFPDSHETNPLIDAKRKQLALKHNPLMVSRRVEKDGVLLGHTKWVEEANGFVEKLVSLTGIEEGMPSTSEKPQGITPVSRAPGLDDEGASESPEGHLGEELQKLLEGKDGATNESLNGDSDDGSFELDYLEDDMGDITVHEPSIQGESSVGDNPLEEPRFKQPNGNEVRTTTPPEQPVLTKQSIMDLVANNIGGIVPGTGWEQRNQSYSDMIKGYESPTGSTVRASVELAALMVIAAVSENATRVSLRAQQEQNEKLVQQAEEHKSKVERQFSESMLRMQAESEKTIKEASRIREEYEVSSRMAQDTYDQMIQKVDGQQNANVFGLQMECLRKRASRLEAELSEVMEKHEGELKKKEDLCSSYLKELESEVKKNRSLREEIRDYEDKVMNGLIPPIEKGARNPSSIEEAPKSKRIKIEGEAELKIITLEVDVHPRVRPKAKNMMTSAYTQSRRDDANLKTIVKDPSSIRTTEQASVPIARKTSVHTSSSASVWENTEEPTVALVTREQKNKALKMWKDLMLTTNDYLPSRERTEAGHVKEIRFLKTAMLDFKMMKLKGLAALKSEHELYSTVKGRYFIPKEFCMPDQFFQEVARDRNVLYWKRCCSVMDFYNLCCMDTPFFKDKKRPDKRESKGINPQAFRQVRSDMSYDPHVRSEQPPRQQSTMQSQRHDTVHIPSSNPSRLDEEQIESAEKAEVRRRAPKRNAPIPESDDSTNTDGETNRLFESKLLPEQKAKISKLLQEMKRIKQRNYSPGYMRDKERDIKAAEADRLAGLSGPSYLEGVKSPWNSDRGHASTHYDYHQIDVIARQIENIKSSNAVMCQLEYTATKGGPGGQVRN